MTDVRTRVRLSREALAAAGRPHPAPPARIVHMGVGAFHRAHQAWYTARASDAADWGIVGFTGRSAEAADLLDPQDGLYTLVERGAESDTFTVVGSLVEVAPGAYHEQFLRRIAARQTAIVTLTITEAGYGLDPQGMPDLADPELQAELSRLRGGDRGVPPRSPLVRLLDGLSRRRAASAGAIAIVPCDNVPGNGPWLRAGLLTLARAVSSDLAGWIEEYVDFVSTSVDRITPRSTLELQDEVAEATGWVDAAPVVTEPFTDWVLSGDFRAGRPAWESAGARFVSDIEPWELRKLRLLNGAHTLLANLGIGLGHQTVAEAIADPTCRAAVERFWDEAARHLPEGLDVAAYRSALLSRFANPRIQHRLDQIAIDSSTKLRLRIVPVALAERAAGRRADASAAAIAAWIELTSSPGRTADTETSAIEAALAEPRPVLALLAQLSAELAADDDFVLSLLGHLQGL